MPGAYSPSKPMPAEMEKIDFTLDDAPEPDRPDGSGSGRRAASEEGRSLGTIRAYPACWRARAYASRPVLTARQFAGRCPQ
jgi:hypothetical protein